MRTRLLPVLSLLVLFAAACSPEATTAPSQPALSAAKGGGKPPCPGLPNPTTAIQLAPNAVTVLAGATGTLTATNQAGLQIPPCALTWSSSAPRVATVNADAVVTALVKGGPITITARTGGKKSLGASVALTVVSALPAVSTLTGLPTGVLVVVGEQVQFTVEARDGLGVVLWGYPVTWTSYNLLVAIISPNGLVTALAGGTADVEASAGGVSEPAKVSVNPGWDVNVLCRNEWGWAVFGDCNQGNHPTGSQIQVSFRVVDANNQDIPGATMTFEVDPVCGSSCDNPGSVSPAQLSSPDANNQFVVLWTLGPNPGYNRLAASSGDYGVGIWATGIAVVPPPPDILSGLRAYFPFTGNAQDASGNNQHGTVGGGTTLAPDRFGNPDAAYGFSDPGYIDIGQLDLTGAFTLSAWIRPDIQTVGAVISKFAWANVQGYELLYAGQQAQHCMRLHTSGLRGTLGFDCGIPLELGRWYHVVGTYDGTSWGRLYLDGVLVAELSGLLPDLPEGPHTLIGRSAWGAQTFLGLIDEVRIYERALTAEQIAYLATVP